MRTLLTVLLLCPAIAFAGNLAFSLHGGMSYTAISTSDNVGITAAGTFSYNSPKLVGGIGGELLSKGSGVYLFFNYKLNKRPELQPYIGVTGTFTRQKVYAFNNIYSGQEGTGNLLGIQAGIESWAKGNVAFCAELGYRIGTVTGGDAGLSGLPMTTAYIRAGIKLHFARAKTKSNPAKH